MQNGDRVQIRAKIEGELKDLDNQIKTLKSVTQPISPDNAIGRITRMDAINNKAVNDDALIKARNRKEKLSEVLDKMELPGFGICVRCKTTIPLLRLMHVPETKVCVNCGK